MNDEDKSKKTVEIIVNGTPHNVEKGKITYDEVVTLALGSVPSGEGIQVTVQYTKGHNDKPQGFLKEGQSVEVKDGMEFDVTDTNRS